MFTVEFKVSILHICGASVGHRDELFSCYKSEQDRDGFMADPGHDEYRVRTLLVSPFGLESFLTPNLSLYMRLSRILSKISSFTIL